MAQALRYCKLKAKKTEKLQSVHDLNNCHLPERGYALRFSKPELLPMRFYKTMFLLHLFQQYAWESLAVMEKGNDMENIRRESLLKKPPSPEPLYEKRKAKRT